MKYTIVVIQIILFLSAVILYTSGIITLISQPFQYTTLSVDANTLANDVIAISMFICGVCLTVLFVFLVIIARNRKLEDSEVELL